MYLKELITDPDFSFSFNNFYNSRPWWLLVVNDLPRMLTLWYGRRELLDSLVGKELTPEALQEIQDVIDLALMANTWKYDHLYGIYAAEYNPIWNYEGTERRDFQRDYADAHTGKDTDTNSGTDTTSYKGTQKDTNSGDLQEARTTFDSDTDYDTNKTTDTRATERTFTNRQDELKHGRKIETDYNSTNTIGETIVETTTRGGNMGVVSTQNMMLQEIDVSRRLDLLKEITLDIVSAICYN